VKNVQNAIWLQLFANDENQAYYGQSATCLNCFFGCFQEDLQIQPNKVKSVTIIWNCFVP